MAKIVRATETWGDFEENELYVSFDRSVYGVVLFSKKLGRVSSKYADRFVDAKINSRTCKRLTRQAKKAGIPL